MQKISNNNNIHKKWNYQIALKKFKYLKVYNNNDNNNTKNMGRTTKNLYSFCTEYIRMYVCLYPIYACTNMYVMFYIFFLSMQAVKLADKLQQQQHMMSTASFIHRLVGFSVAPSNHPNPESKSNEMKRTLWRPASLCQQHHPLIPHPSLPAFPLFAIQLTS